MCICAAEILSGFQIHVDGTRDRPQESRNYLTGPDVGGGTGIAFITRLLRLLRLTPVSLALSLVAPSLAASSRFARHIHAVFSCFFYVVSTVFKPRAIKPHLACVYRAVSRRVQVLRSGWSEKKGDSGFAPLSSSRALSSPSSRLSSFKSSSLTRHDKISILLLCTLTFLTRLSKDYIDLSLRSFANEISREGLKHVKHAW